MSEHDAELSPLESHSDEDGVVSLLVLPQLGDRSFFGGGGMFLSSSFFRSTSRTRLLLRCPARYCVKSTRSAFNLSFKSSLILRCSPNSSVSSVIFEEFAVVSCPALICSFKASSARAKLCSVCNSMYFLFIASSCLFKSVAFF